MSFSATRWAWGQTTSMPNEKYVLLAFANYANDSGLSYPSIPRLCSISQLNRKTVIKAIQALIDLDLLIDTGDKIGRTGRVKVYKLPTNKQQTVSDQSAVDNLLTDPIKEPLGAETVPEQVPFEKVIVPKLPSNRPNSGHSNSPNVGPLNLSVEPISKPSSFNGGGGASSNNSNPPTTSNEIALINSDFKPTEQDYQILAGKNISREFVDAQLFEFIEYWKEESPQKNYRAKFRRRVIKNHNEELSNETPSTGKNTAHKSNHERVLDEIYARCKQS